MAQGERIWVQEARLSIIPGLTPDRGPGQAPESRTPESHWIPAFAGMTLR